MLRISVVDNGAQDVTLELEGSLAGPWVGEVRRISCKALAESKKLALDLGNLRFADADGLELLRKLAAKRVEQRNCSPFIRQQLMGEAND